VRRESVESGKTILTPLLCAVCDLFSAEKSPNRSLSPRIIMSMSISGPVSGCWPDRRPCKRRQRNDSIN
jgi:hypothetical protein